MSSAVMWKAMEAVRKETEMKMRQKYEEKLREMDRKHEEKLRELDQKLLEKDRELREMQEKFLRCGFSVYEVGKATGRSIDELKKRLADMINESSSS